MADGSLIVQLVEQLAPELDNHARVLSEFAARVAARRDQLIAAWDQAEQAQRTSQALPTAVLPREQYARDLQALVDGLRLQNGAALDVRAYLSQLDAWARQLAAVGMDYAGAMRHLTALRRALLPVLVELYEPGPEMQLTFDALDTLERVEGIIVAGAYIQAAQERLRQSARLRVVGRLAGGIVHSLNNLLAAIYGRTQLLEQAERDQAVLHELRAIEYAARSAGENLRRVQEYAALRPDEEATPVDVEALIGETVLLTRYRWRDDAEASGIVIDVIKDLADVPPVLARRSQLRDALVELILNAVEAMPLGGIVTMRTERVGEQVLISVSDIGEGMDAATRAHAAEPFFTTKGAEHIGLGLTMVQTVATAHGGSFVLASTPGRGALATLALPMSPFVPEPAKRGPYAPSRALNLLIVDDDPGIREVAAKSLDLRGHRAATAESGSDALRRYQFDGPFDVVLTDLGMPGMNGLELARALKKLDPRVLVILMTGWAGELDPKKVRESGIARAINKPFDVEQVLELIHEAQVNEKT